MKTLFPALALVLAPACATNEEAPPPVEQPEPESAADFAIAVDAGAMDVMLSGSASVTVNVTRSGGFADPIEITMADLPVGVTATPVTVTGDGPAVITLTASSQDALALPSLSRVVATSGDRTRSADLTVTVIGTAGMLDPTFGLGGRDLRSTVFHHNEQMFGSVVLEDGAIIAVALDRTSNEIVLLHYDATGALSAWGNSPGGIRRYAAPGTGAWVSVTLQRDSQGRLVVAARSGSTSTFMMRVTTEGEVDTAFAGGTPALAYGCSDMVLDTADRPILLCRDGNTDSLIRIGTNGALDLSFGGGDGRQQLGVNSSGGALTVDSSGRVIAALLDRSIDFRQTLVRLLPSGALDPSFDFDGIKAMPLQAEENVVGVTTIGDDIYVLLDTIESLAVQHYDGSGQPDTTFATVGRYKAPGRYPSAILASGDGLLIAAQDANGVPQFGRLDASGAPAAFGTSGWMELQLAAGQSTWIGGLSHFDEHRILVTGSVFAIDTDLLMARLWM